MGAVLLVAAAAPLIPWDPTSLAHLVFSSQEVTDLVANASAPPLPRALARQRMWTPWSCAAEDNFVGLAVHLATRTRNLSAAFWCLSGLVADAALLSSPHDSRNPMSTHTLQRALTVHKLEMDDTKLQYDADREAALNVKAYHKYMLANTAATTTTTATAASTSTTAASTSTTAASTSTTAASTSTTAASTTATPPTTLTAPPRRLPFRNDTFRSTRALSMRRLRPMLEALSHNNRAPPRVVRCYDVEEVRAARAYDAAHPCGNVRKERWCRPRLASCNETTERGAEIRSSCNLACGLCTPRALPASVASFLENYGGYERWRFCEVIERGG